MIPTAKEYFNALDSIPLIKSQLLNPEIISNSLARNTYIKELQNAESVVKDFEDYNSYVEYCNQQIELSSMIHYLQDQLWNKHKCNQK